MANFTLRPDDEAAFDRHLASCADGAALVDGVQVEGERVGVRVDGVRVDGVRIVRIRDTLAPGLLLPLQRPARPSEGLPSRAEAGQAVPSEGATAPGAPRRRDVATRRLLSVAAAAAVAAGAVVVALSLPRGAPAPPSALDACRASPGCSVAVLTSPDGARQAAVLIRAGRASVVPLAIGTPRTGRVWALWQLPRRGRPTLLAEFAGGPSGEPTDSTALALPVPATAGFAVSDESAVGVPTTSGRVIASGLLR